MCGSFFTGHVQFCSRRDARPVCGARAINVITDISAVTSKSQNWMLSWPVLRRHNSEQPDTGPDTGQ